MKKIFHITWILFSVFIISCVQTGNKKKSNLEDKKPNVLFICVDDLRPELACSGYNYIHSPNIDKLAKSGTMFTNQFVQIPTCGASRYSMLTGMLPRIKAHLSNDACEKFIAEKTPSNMPETFIHHLRNNGYYTVGIGKISHSADGFVYEYTEPLSSKRELPQSWDELLFNPGKWGTGWNAFFGYADGENRQSMKRKVKPYEKGEVDDMGYVDGLTAELAIRKLQELSKKKKPFFLGVGFFKPHLPFNAPKKYWDFYDEENIPLPPFANIPKNVNKASLHESGEFNGYLLGEEKSSLNASVSEQYAKKLRHAYFACISYTDALIGKLLDKLESLGLTENTVVVVWGDHGWHLGDHMVWGKHTIFERSLNSAFIVKAPGLNDGKVVDNIVSAVDIYPTIIDFCGIEMPYQTDGKSLIPLINGEKQKWQETSYGYFRNGISLRTERYRLTKYFRKQKPTIELYDHLKDPNETINIADENPEIVETLMPIWERGNTGLYNN